GGEGGEAGAGEADGAVATVGVNDTAATCVFTALQTNTSLRVLRMRGAVGLTLRSLRAAGEMLRRNTCLSELDLSNSSFNTCATASSSSFSHARSTAAAGNDRELLREPCSSAAAAGLGAAAVLGSSRPLSQQSSLTSMPSSSRGSLTPMTSLQLAHSQSHSEQPCDGTLSAATTTHGSALAAAAGISDGGQRASSSSSSIPHAPSLPSQPRASSTGSGGGGHSHSQQHHHHHALVRPPSLRRLGSFAHGGGGGSAGGLTAASEALDAEDVEVLGAIWSALAGGVAANGRLRVLRLAHCNVGSVGAAALAPALMQNSTLRELDLSGLPAATAKIHLASVIARAATNLAAAAASSSSSSSAAAAAAAAAAASSGVGCSLVALLATSESYEQVDLLQSDKVT
ncbi:hypothetical protein Agub_g4476, partial [Astrephomene gubernaculifera]